MTGWMDTIPGLTAGLGMSPFTGGASLGAAVGTAAGSSGGLSGTSSSKSGHGPVSPVEIEGPLNIVAVDGIPLEFGYGGSGRGPVSFNSNNMGLPPVHRNKNDTINEIVKNAPPPDKTKDLSKIPEDAKSDLRKYLEWEDKKDREDTENIRYKVIDWVAGIPEALHAKGKEVGVGIGESGKGAFSGIATGLGEGASKHFGIDGIVDNGKEDPDWYTIALVGGAFLLLIVILKR